MGRVGFPAWSGCRPVDVSSHETMQTDMVQFMYVQYVRTSYICNVSFPWDSTITCCSLSGCLVTQETTLEVWIHTDTPHNFTQR